MLCCEHGTQVLQQLLFGLVWLWTKCGNHHPNVVTTLVQPSSVAAVRSKDRGPPDWTNFGLDRTAQTVCGPKTENYGPDCGWIRDHKWTSGISKISQPLISYRSFDIQLDGLSA